MKKRNREKRTRQGETENDSRWGNLGDWAEERQEEIENSKMAFDPTLEIYCPLKWQGIYTLRLLPVVSSQDWMMQAGWHYNVIPQEEGEDYILPGCPEFTFGEECPICFGINKALAEKVITWDDLKGLKSPRTATKYLVRGVLFDFECSDKEKTYIEFTELPAIKVFGFSYNVQKKLTARLNDRRRFGPKKLMHPEYGRDIIIKKDEKTSGYYEVDVMDAGHEIPEEFLNEDHWPELEDHLPEYHTDDILELLRQNAKVIPDFIADMVLSIDANPKKSKALIPVNRKRRSREEQEEEPELDQDNEEGPEEEENEDEKYEKQLEDI